MVNLVFQLTTEHSLPFRQVAHKNARGLRYKQSLLYQIGVIDLIKTMAVQLPLTDMAKRKALKEKTGFDVDKALVHIEEEKAEEKEDEIQLITEDEKAEQLGCGGCTGNCATCSGCSDQQALESIEKGDLLIINKKTGLISIAKPNMLDDLDIDDYEFYELSPVFVEKVVSYKITHL